MGLVARAQQTVRLLRNIRSACRYEPKEIKNYHGQFRCVSNSCLGARMPGTGGRAKRKNRSVFVASHQKDSEDFPQKFPYWQLSYVEYSGFCFMYGKSQT